MSEMAELEKTIGEEFLMWLWKSSLEDYSNNTDSVNVYIEDMIVLTNQNGEIKEMMLKKGNPSESIESFEALSRGMRPSKAKVRIVSGETEWSFNFDSTSFNLSSVKLPSTQTSDIQGRLLDRVFLIEECCNIMENKYICFIENKIKDPEQFDLNFTQWIKTNLLTDRE